MKISVIVPFWNSEKWIGDCCESLTRQEGDFEFILVNDSSTDRGKDIVYTYCDKDARFRAVDNQCGKGVSGARNTGLDIADGDLITFLDADDELLDGAYDTFTGTMITDPGAEMYQLNHIRYYQDLNKSVLKYANDQRDYSVTDLPILWFSIWNKLFKANFVKDIRFDERLQYGEDGLFILECLSKGAYIHHAPFKAVAVKHKFINKQSLSKVKDAESRLKQVHAYEEFMLRQQDPDLRVMICEELSRLWGADTFKRCIGYGE